MILLTTSIDVDRTGKQYGEKVDPDELIPAPASGSAAANGLVNPADAATIEAAKALAEAIVRQMNRSRVAQRPMLLASRSLNLFVLRHRS
jgi:hypothetical protein